MKNKELLERVQKQIKDNCICMLDLKYVDLTGKFRHITLPAGALTEDLLKEGVGFDGSSVGFKDVKSGDMCVIPDLETAFIDPYWELPTISMLCDIVEADTRAPFMGDPRSTAKRTLEYAQKAGIAESIFLLPELEFNIMDQVNWEVTPHTSFIDIRCDEIKGTTDADENPIAGQWIPHQQGYHRGAPQDFYRDVRNEMMNTLAQMGVDVKYHHHEVGATGQQEIEMSLSPMIAACDHTMLTKYVVHNAAVERGLIATFMPKPIAGEAGNGMHIHIRLVGKKNAPVFYDEKDPMGLSEMAYCFIGGMIKHGRSLTAFTNPSTNSYRRLMPVFEAPTNMFFSMGSRNSAIRIPKYATSPDKKRFEIRCPDATSNIYFAASAVIMAGLDGVKNGIHARKMGWGPYTDITTEPASVRRKIISLPENLDEALKSLKADHAYLMEGNVFSKQLIDGWIDLHHRQHVLPMLQTPTPLEFQLYFGC
ncbi:MAG: type I glutamate--ammonia ligase [bacterium]